MAHPPRPPLRVTHPLVMTHPPRPWEISSDICERAVCVMARIVRLEAAPLGSLQKSRVLGVPLGSPDFPSIDLTMDITITMRSLPIGQAKPFVPCWKIFNRQHDPDETSLSFRLQRRFRGRSVAHKRATDHTHNCRLASARKPLQCSPLLRSSLAYPFSPTIPTLIKNHTHSDQKPYPL